MKVHMEFLDACDPEWSEMWELLADSDLNNGDPLCIFMGESWEYMGSTPDHHHLKHKKHPKTGQAEYLYIERHKAAISWASGWK